VCLPRVKNDISCPCLVHDVMLCDLGGGVKGIQPANASRQQAPAGAPACRFRSVDLVQLFNQFLNQR